MVKGRGRGRENRVAEKGEGQEVGMGGQVGRQGGKVPGREVGCRKTSSFLAKVLPCERFMCLGME